MLYWILNGSTFLVLFAILVIVWFQKLWIIFGPVDDDDPSQIKRPASIWLRKLFKLSGTVMQSALARLFIYISSVILLVVSALIHLVECDIAVDEDGYRASDASSLVQDHPCMNSWSITQSLIIAICTSFFFIRIHFLFKFLIGAIIVAVYGWLIFVQFHVVYDRSPSINASLNAKVAHILIFIFLSVIFHFIDRQAEYISKIDYK